MGITGFAKFIEETFPNVIKVTSIRNLDIAGKIAVDGFNECYLQMYVTKSQLIKELTFDNIYEYFRIKEYRDNLTNKVRKLWLIRIIEFITVDLNKNVVWVFDGDNVPTHKDGTRQERKTRLDKIRADMTNAMNEFVNDDFPDIAKYRRILSDYLTSRPPTWEDYEILSVILMRMGIPVVRAWGEGEKTCARLCNPENTPQDLLCSAVWSADVDSILFGAPILIQRKRNIRGENFEGAQVRVFNASSLPISLGRLIKICVATGCDYLPKGIPGLGLKKAYKLYGQTDPEPPFPEEHQHILQLFEHNLEEEKIIRLTLDMYPERANDLNVRWFTSIYA
jgi:5'-3' exonuclease